MGMERVGKFELGDRGMGIEMSFLIPSPSPYSAHYILEVYQNFFARALLEIGGLRADAACARIEEAKV